jgi:uncharacterized protein (TIRG00374 family)
LSQNNKFYYSDILFLYGYLMEGIDTITTLQTAEVEQSTSNKKQSLFTLLKILVSMGLIYWILRDTNLGEIFRAMSSANLPLLILAGSLHLVGFTISAYRWRLLLKAQGADASILFLIRSYIVSMFFNNFLPSTIGGDAIRAYDSWQVGRNKSSAVVVIFVDRFLGMLALMLFALGAILVTDELTANIPFLYFWILLGVMGMLLVVWVIFMPSRQVSTLIAKIRLPFWQKLQALINAFLAFQGQKSTLAGALGLSLLLHANVIIHYYLIAKALGLPIPLYNFFLIIPLVTVLMMLPVSINAIGIRENAFVFFFAAFGVLKPEAVAFAWIAYGLVLLQGVLGGVVYALRQ